MNDRVLVEPFVDGKVDSVRGFPSEVSKSGAIWATRTSGPPDVNDFMIQPLCNLV